MAACQCLRNECSTTAAAILRYLFSTCYRRIHKVRSHISTPVLPSLVPAIPFPNSSVHIKPNDEAIPLPRPWLLEIVSLGSLAIVNCTHQSEHRYARLFEGVGGQNRMKVVQLYTTFTRNLHLRAMVFILYHYISL